jgi:hypothetical protein
LLTRVYFIFLRFIILLQLLIINGNPCSILLASESYKLNANIFDGNRLIIQVYPTSAFLNTYEYKPSTYDIVHNGPLFSKECWIDINVMFIIYRHC